MRFTLGFTFWRFRADRVKPVGACRTCGYDTSGLAAGALCPECGKAAGSKT
jgi:rubrerythrin